MLKRLRGVFKENRGFTLIELLVVMAILGVLGATIALSMGQFTGTAEVASANVEASSIKVACQAYRVDEDEFPTNSTELGEYIEGELKARYWFDTGNGEISSVDFVGISDSWDNIKWDNIEKEWVKK